MIYYLYLGNDLVLFPAQIENALRLGYVPFQFLHHTLHPHSSNYPRKCFQNNQHYKCHNVNIKSLSILVNKINRDSNNKAI